MQENNQKELILIEDLGMLKPNEKLKYKARMGIYKCHCGKEFKTFINNVKVNKIKSCGCLYRKHNLGSSKIYKVWYSMLSRCTNKNHKYFKDYGGRGITICDRWNSFIDFIEDMYPSYQEGLSIDRINPNGNYEKDNCRWATKIIQARNTRILRIDNSSGYRGVSYVIKHNKWKAQIKVNSKKIHLGTFNSKLEAAKAYDYYVLSNNLEHTKNF